MFASIFELTVQRVYGTYLFEGIGFIFVIIGALWAIYALVPFKK